MSIEVRSSKRVTHTCSYMDRPTLLPRKVVKEGTQRSSEKDSKCTQKGTPGEYNLRPLTLYKRKINLMDSVLSRIFFFSFFVLTRKVYTLVKEKFLYSVHYKVGVVNINKRKTKNQKRLVF